MNLTERSKIVHAANVAKGFYERAGDANIGERLMLIVSELSEALEAHRKNEFAKVREFNHFGGISDTDENFNKAFKAWIKDSFEDELADVQIRLLDLCGFLNIDLEFHVQQKLKYNALRPHKHGKEY